MTRHVHLHGPNEWLVTCIFFYGFLHSRSRASNGPGAFEFRHKSYEISDRGAPAARARGSRAAAPCKISPRHKKRGGTTRANTRTHAGHVRTEGGAREVYISAMQEDYSAICAGNSYPNWRIAPLHCFVMIRF